MDLELRGRIAFITGANGGIGKAIAQGFANEGVHLALFTRNEKKCLDFAEKLQQSNDIRVAVVTFDFEHPELIPGAVAKAVKQLGAVDILVNNAGGATRGRLEEITDEAWDRCFAVKPIGLMRMTREVIPYIIKSNQARIINIAGTRGREPAWVSVMSGPINFGTLSATKALANALGPKGVTVNAVNPGSTDTGRWDELKRLTASAQNISLAEAEKYLLREVPMGRVVKTTDIADLVLFLASAHAGMINGCAINVDGGRTRSI